MELKKINNDQKDSQKTKDNKKAEKKFSLPNLPFKLPKLPKLPKFPKFSKKSSTALYIVGGLLAFILLLVLAIGIPAYSMRQPLQETVNSGRQITESIQQQDLAAAQTHLDQTKESLKTVDKRYQRLIWLKFVPGLRIYYLDGQHGLNATSHSLQAGQKLIAAINPYADLLGFEAKDGQAEVETQSAEERILFLTQTLDAISPQLEEINTDLQKAQEELDQINPKHYPYSVAGKKVRPNIIKAQETFQESRKALSESRPLIQLLPQLLGQDEEKVYLLLFQNDGEIRPTGGFLTAYAYIKVHEGKITPLESRDIYHLDARFNKNVEAPPAIQKFLDEYTWHLRNMNLSPDFKTSMDTFMGYFRDVPGTREVDGVIAIDTQIPVRLLEVLGPVGVGGWGEFSADIDERCDCPQVVYALENIATRQVGYIREDRKAVLGPLMHSILANAMGSPKHLWPKLLNVGLESIQEKHLLFYFFDESSQDSAESFQAAGRIRTFDGDYLHINDANFGGAKSNLFVEQSVEQEITNSNGQVEKTVTINYNNPHPSSNCDPEAPGLCLNAVLHQWVRLYVPQGAQLIEVIGSETAAAESEDLGKTVFESSFTLRPQSSSKLVFKYKLPGEYPQTLPLMIQKQPGKPNIKHQIIYNGSVYEEEVAGDLKINLE